MLTRLILSIVLALLAVPALAQREEVPFWASLDAEKVNMRVGPSRDYRIDWVYRRDGLPVRVVRVSEGWWLVRDADGTQGWMARSLLSKRRSAVVTPGDPAPIRDAPANNAALLWRAEAGVVGRLGECEAGWCAFDIMGRAGWMRADRLWGAGPP